MTERARMASEFRKGRKLHPFVATSWLSLARQDEAIGNLFASWDTDKPIREPAIGRH